jgi:hypothetical protein
MTPETPEAPYQAAVVKLTLAVGEFVQVALNAYVQARGPDAAPMSKALSASEGEVVLHIHTAPFVAIVNFMSQNPAAVASRTLFAVYMEPDGKVRADLH